VGNRLFRWILSALCILTYLACRILVTASTLVETSDCEKNPAAAYKHDNIVLNIERSFFEKEESWTAAGCINTILFNWFGKRKPDGYIKI